ncbi:hypothetical protein SAMD00079811_30050 [Scytonema sp. HK-05]|nr:hypothetical protein SAMD00079811_30050 [Scytonema sp. HK-05]
MSMITKLTFAITAIAVFVLKDIYIPRNQDFITEYWGLFQNNTTDDPMKSGLCRYYSVTPTSTSK